MTQQPSRALAALRAATASQHAALESHLRIAAPGAGRREYAAHVAALWSWMQPFEASLWRAPWPREVDAASRAVKLGWLEADIAAARADGYLAPPLEPALRTPALEDLAQRMGVAYVIEGSLLGAQVLLRRLGPVLHPWPARWLRGYGREAGPRWVVFLAALAGHVHSPDDIERAAESACDAFSTLGECLRVHEAAVRASPGEPAASLR